MSVCFLLVFVVVRRMVQCQLKPGSPCRCMMDSDDEVRDRATFYMNVLQQKQKALNAAYIFNGK